MAAPISGQSSPITYNNQRLIVQGENGVIKKYRLVIRKKGQEVPLTAEQEKKAALAIQKILTEAGLNHSGIDLSKASLKGRVVTYEGKPSAKQPEQTTYKEFKDLIDSVKIPAQKAVAPAKEAIRNAAPKPPSAAPEATKATKVNVNGEEKEGFAAGFLSRVQSITNIFRSNVPEGAKSLEQISAALENAITQEGKLRLENNALVVTKKEIGIPSRKGGKKSEAALTFLLTEVQKTLDKKSITENEKILVQDLLNKLAMYPWAQTSFEKNPRVLSLYEKAKSSLQEKNTVAEHFFTPKELFATLVNPTKPETVENFFIGYRAVFKGTKSEEELKEIKEGAERYREMQAMRSVTMLNFLRDQANDSISPSFDEKKAEAALVNLISTWLNDDNLNGKDYLNPGAEVTIRTIVSEPPFSVDSPGVRNLLTLLDEKLDEKLDIQPLKLKDNALKLAQEFEKVKRGELSNTKYQELVKQFADDLSTLGFVSLKEIGLGEIDISTTAMGPGYLKNADYLNKLSNFVTKEILTPTDSVKPKKSAERMMIFFNAVLKELIAMDKYDSAVQVQGGMEAHPITRLELTPIPENVKTRSVSMVSSKGKEQMGIMYARADKKNFIPHIGLIRGKLNSSSETLPSTRKNSDGATLYNLFKISRNAEIKRGVLEVQRSASGVGKLNLDGIKELFERKSSKADRDAEQNELYKLSEAIVPRQA